MDDRTVKQDEKADESRRTWRRMLEFFFVNIAFLISFAVIRSFPYLKKKSSGTRREAAFFV